MKIIFFGSSDFSLPFLEGLKQCREHPLLAVVTTPEKPKGRGLKLEKSAVGRRAEALGIRVFSPEKLRDEGFQTTLRSMSPDLFVVASYGRILPSPHLGIPKILPLNIHPSLLPRYRGAAPIPWQILNGEEKTGITFFKMNEGMDTGDIVLQVEEPMNRRDTSASLTDRLSRLGADELVPLLDAIEKGKYSVRPQDHRFASAAPKLKKEEGEIDWKESAARIDRKIRAFNPWPTAYTFFKEEPLKILAAEPAEVSCAEAEPGVILEMNRDGFMRIQTGSKGALILREVQWAGRKRMSAYQFALGARLKAGNSLTTS